jgi:hypothetical protein
LSPPEAKFRRFRLTPQRQRPTSKRLARALWGEIRRVSPHEKKEKDFSEAKFDRWHHHQARVAL